MPNGKFRIYVDSCVYLDLITKNEDTHDESRQERWRVARALFKAVNDDIIQLAASPLVEAEVLCNGIVREGVSDVRRMLNGWFTAPSTAWVDIDRVASRKAVAVLDEYRKLSPDSNKMKSADALHLALAIRLSCDYLMTHDKGFPIGNTIEGVRIMRPKVVWPEPLFDF